MTSCSSISSLCDFCFCSTERSKVGEKRQRLHGG